MISGLGSGCPTVSRSSSHGAPRYSITEGDPLSARYQADRAVGLSRGDWATRVVAENELSSDATYLHFNATLRAFDDGECFFDRAWSFEIPRDFL